MGGHHDQPLAARVLLLWLAGSALLILTNFAALSAVHWPDPDDQLRLLEVRSWLAGQSWFDVHQYRIAPPQGVAMHWSRLVDVPLAAVILMLTPLLGQSMAETVAAIAVPLLTLGCLLWLVCRLTARFLDREAAMLAGLLCLVAAPLALQFRPLRIDHHGWQMVAALLAITGLFARDPRKGGWITGGALALWLNISIEGLPLAAVIIGVLALRWLRDPAQRWGFVQAMMALAGGSLLLFLGTRGLSDLGNHCDAIAPVHLALFVWGALGAQLLAVANPARTWVLLAGLAGIAGGAFAILSLLAPQCAGGAFVALDPLVREFWYQSVTEGLPVWRVSLGSAAQLLGPVLLGGVGLGLQLLRSRGEVRLRWIELGLVLLAASLITLLVMRAGGVAAAIAAIPAAGLLQRGLMKARSLRQPLWRVLATLLVLALMAPGIWLAMALGQFRPSPLAQAQAKDAIFTTCEISQAAPQLASLPTGTIFAPIDIGPDLLLTSPHNVIATGHHRGSAGMQAVIAGFLAEPSAARGIIAARGADYVALCPGLIEPQNYRKAAPHGLAARLLAGQAPDWLEPLPRSAGSALLLWQVKP